MSDDLSIMQNSDAIGTAENGSEIVTDHHSGQVVFPNDIPEHIVHKLGHYRVEACGGIVEQKHLWIPDDGTGNTDALLHSPRQCCGKLL